MLTIEHWLSIIFAVVSLVIQLWAFIDCLGRKSRDFLAVGRQSKNFWLLLTGISAAVGTIMTALPLLFYQVGTTGLLTLVALCVAAVYLAGPRREIKGDTGGYAF